MSEKFTISPTIIRRRAGGGVPQGVMTARDPELGDILYVFRSPEEAAKYQEQTGQHREGFEAVRASPHEIVKLCEEYGLGFIAMPEAWTGGEGRVDFFTVEGFVRLLLGEF